MHVRYLKCTLTKGQQDDLAHGEETFAADCARRLSMPNVEMLNVDSVVAPRHLLEFLYAACTLHNAERRDMLIRQLIDETIGRIL